MIEIRNVFIAARGAAHDSEQSESSNESDAFDEETSNGNMLATKEQMMESVKKIYLNTRARELSVSYNQEVLSELIHERCSRWADMSRDHLYTVSSIVNTQLWITSLWMMRFEAASELGFESL
ncbi:hypothetical protein PMIN03_011487 [Paraphaeosphaeria minitans]